MRRSALCALVGVLIGVVVLWPPAGARAEAGGDAAVCSAPVVYRGEAAAQTAVVQWLVRRARARGSPDELPVMASLVESGLHNLNFADRDSVGYFQMRVAIWNTGPYAGFPDDPELQITWFIDQALAVKAQRIAAGDTQFGNDPSTYGEWIADVERPAEQYRGRYQLRLDEARTLVGQACTNQPDPDTDHDGIPNELDVAGTELPTFSDSVPPAATTGNRGVITATNGLSVKVADLPSPAGVRIATTGSGGPA